jgi:hypothetical protein
MESKKAKKRMKATSDEDSLALLMAGGVLACAAYGLYKLFSKDTEPRRSIANLKETAFIDDFVDREIV